MLFWLGWVFMQVVVELIVGLVLCMWAALTVPGNFLSIHPHSDENRLLFLSLLLLLFLISRSYFCQFGFLSS
jgi:hypothetical protein